MQLDLLLVALPPTLCSYNRDLMGTTLRAMARVAEIKEAREKRFYALRMRGVKKLEAQQQLREIKQGIDLVVSPLVRQKEELNQTQTVRTRTRAEKKQDMEE